MSHAALGNLPFHVLLALADGVPLHGYGVGRDVLERSGGELRPTTGGLYLALKRLQEDGTLKVGLENAIIGTEFIDARVYIATMQEAQANHEEDFIGDLMKKFGLFEEPVDVDGKLSVMLDYELGSVSIFRTLIDEIRPVTDETLRAAGIEKPEGVGEVNDLWIGRATAVFGFFRPEREFVLYFALHFDRDSMVFDAADDETGE